MASESTKGTWHRPCNTDKFSDGFASLGNQDCAGCRRGLPLRNGIHYEFGREFCKHTEGEL